MISRLRDISLRAKITIGFVLIVLGGTSISTLIGSRIIAKAMLNEALKRVHNGLDAASVMSTACLERDRPRIIHYPRDRDALEVKSMPRGTSFTARLMIAGEEEKDGAAIPDFARRNILDTSTDPPQEPGFLCHTGRALHRRTAY
jgi:hypothetical protein